MKYVELNVKSTSGYKAYQRNIPSYLHNRPKSLVVYLLDKIHSVTESMVQSVKPYESDDEQESETDTALNDQTEQIVKRVVQCVISTVEKKYLVASNSIFSNEVKPYIVEFGNLSQACKCSCPSFRRNRMLCKHFFAVIKAGKETFQDVSPIFRSHPLHLIDNEIFDHQLYKDDNVLQAPNEEERMQRGIFRLTRT